MKGAFIYKLSTFQLAVLTNISWIVVQTCWEQDDFYVPMRRIKIVTFHFVQIFGSTFNLMQRCLFFLLFRSWWPWVCHSCQETNGVCDTGSWNQLFVYGRPAVQVWGPSSVRRWASLQTQRWSQTGTASPSKRETKDGAHRGTSSNRVTLPISRLRTPTGATASSRPNTPACCGPYRDELLPSISPGSRIRRPRGPNSTSSLLSESILDGQSGETSVLCLLDWTSLSITNNWTTYLEHEPSTQAIHVTPPGSAPAPWDLRVSTEGPEAGTSSRH